MRKPLLAHSVVIKTPSATSLQHNHKAPWLPPRKKMYLPLMKSTACSKPYVSRSQSSLIRAPSLIPGRRLGLSLIRSMVKSMVSRACMPPWGMILPQIFFSSLSCTIMSAPRVRLPSMMATWSRYGQL